MIFFFFLNYTDFRFQILETQQYSTVQYSIDEPCSFSNTRIYICDVEMNNIRRNYCVIMKRAVLPKSMKKRENSIKKIELSVDANKQM